jgi:serralysin
MNTPTTLETYFLNLVNETRDAIGPLGLRRLSFDSELLDSADAHTAWMDQTDTVSLTELNGTSPADRMTAAGYGWQSWAENVAYVPGTLTEATVNQLHLKIWNDPAFQKNIRNGSLEEIGIGLKEGTLNGEKVVFATQDFGIPKVTEMAEPDDIGGYRLPGSVFGTEGDDDIRGTAGADNMYGGMGNDTYYMNDFNDRVWERVGEGYDHVISSVYTYLYSDVYQVERITLVGTDDISATGNNMNNRINGNAGSNELYGIGGNDIINGEGGRDILVGGRGSDTFVFDTAAEAHGDTIRDFSVYYDHYLPGVDKIDLSGIDANVNVAGNQAFTFIGAERFHKVAGELHFYHPGVVMGRPYADTYVSGDTNGDGKADFAIKLDGWHAPGAYNFLL